MDSKTLEQLTKANQRLSKIKVRVKGSKLYLRGTFPPRKEDGILPRQYELSTGLPATSEGIKIAIARAQEIESRLILEKFDWADYLENAELGSKPIRRWLEEFEEHYWNTHEKTPNRENTYYNNYQSFFKLLPQKEALVETNLIPLLVKYEPNSGARLNCFIALNALLKFAGIEHKLDKYKTPYKVRIERELPNDDLVMEIVEDVPKEWLWTFAMLATYGLRGHEFRLLDCSKLRVPPHIIYVHSKTKTGYRPVYPVPAEWVSKWQLWDVYRPPLKEYDNNVDYGAGFAHAVINILDRLNYRGFTAYHFRDAYAVRCSLYGIDAVVAAKWMGHSVQIHWRSYLKFFDESHHKQAWEKAFKIE
jgi:hypothetical protein